MEKVVVLRARRMSRSHVSATICHADSPPKDRQLCASRESGTERLLSGSNLGSWFRNRSLNYLLVGSLSLSAILTNVARESACILRMALPRCTFTVNSVVPSSDGYLLVDHSSDHQLHDFALSRGQFVIALPQLGHVALLLPPSSVAFECLLNCI